MKSCPFCAEQVQDAAVVCKHCGRDLVPGQAQPTPVVLVQPKRKTSLKTWGCLGFILFAVFGMVMGSFQRSEKQDEPLPQPTARKSTPAKPIPSTPVIDIRKIAGMSQEAVEKVLGRPSSSETVRSRGQTLPKNLYRDGDIEIVFVSGRADWITIYGKGALPFGVEVLSAIGLPSSKPTFSNPNATIRWESLPGFREISVFPGQGRNAHYVYVLVKTSPS